MKHILLLAALLAMCTSALAKEPNPADFPLIAHVVSMEKGSNVGATLIFGMPGHGTTLHLRIGGTGYLAKAANGLNTPVEVGRDFPARMNKNTITLLVPTGKNGKLKAFSYNIAGRIE
jgi:hypothetical protein